MVRLFLLFALCSACKTRGAQVIDTGCVGQTAATADGAALFHANEDRVLRVQSGKRETIALKDGCRRASSIAVLDENRIALHGVFSRSFDLWGHAGRSVTASCIVDFSRQRVDAIPRMSLLERESYGTKLFLGASGTLYARDKRNHFQFSGGPEIELPQHHTQDCAVTDDGKHIYSVCPDGNGQSTVYGYDLGSAKLRSTRVIATAPFQQLDGVAARGSLIAYWGRSRLANDRFKVSWGIIDAKAGKEHHRSVETLRGAVNEISLGNDGSWIVSYWVDRGRAGHDGVIQAFDAAGRKRNTISVDTSASVVGFDEQNVWLGLGCGVRRFQL